MWLTYNDDDDDIGGGGDDDNDDDDLSKFDVCIAVTKVTRLVF